MARPIQNTPTLIGEDAKRFRRNLINSLCNKLTSKEIADKKKEMKKMKESYSLLVSISGGTFY